MSTQSYVITRAGQYESSLKSCRAPIQETLYDTLQAAMMDIACVVPGDTAKRAKLASREGADGYYIYLSDEDADDDETGAYAIAVIAPAAEAA